MEPSVTAQSVAASPIRDVAPGPRTLQVTWADGKVGEFHYVWLRDNCPALRHPGNGQRISAVTDFPLDVAPADVRLEEDGTVSVRWSFDHHVSRFRADWLREHVRAKKRHTETESPSAALRTWTAEDWADGLPALNYGEFMHNDEALQGWLAAVRAYGFAVLEDVPVTPGFVLKIVARFGYVRQTNYGRIFDEHVLEEPNNLAFTNLWLRPHTDNPYRDPVPSLQLMHCIENAADDAEGGRTTLTDGFRVAGDLRRRAPELFSLLATLPVRFTFADRDTVLSASRPLIELDPRSGNVQGVCFNHRSTEPFDVPDDLMIPFYEAYRTFAAMLEDPHYHIQFPMRPGTLYIVDNRRVLHGRTACSNGCRRHVQGCYADRDGLLSKLAVLERGRRILAESASS